jgi:phospholipid/cholesterol/gamma-HCH transport system substrate-binding protein
MAAPTRQPRPRLGRRISGWVSRGSEKVDNFKTPLGLAVLALGAFLAYTAFQATTGPPFLPKYRITVKVPSDAPPLRKGEAVRVGGSLAGLINDVAPDPAHGLTLVKVNISKTGFRPLPVDSTAFVRVHSIVYMTYLGIQPGTSDKKLDDGDTLPAVAKSGTDLLEVVELFDRKARQDLSKTLINVGFGAAGRGTELNGALRDLPETSSNLAAQLRALTRTPGALSGLIAGSARTASGLRGERPDDVASLISSADGAFGALARKSAQLSRAIELLPPFEQEVGATAPVANPALAEIARAGSRLTPVVSALNANLPSLGQLVRLGPQLREGFAGLLGGGASGSAGGGGGGSVGTGSGTTGIANQVLIAARPVVAGLFPVQTALGPLNAALQQLLAATTPYRAEIIQAGQWLQSASSSRVNLGSNPGAPVLRGVPVLTPHPCLNAEPAVGQAQKDRASGDDCG